MSWQATGWVSAEVRGLTPSQRMVLLTMANYVDPEGFGFFAGRARLADEVELSERQVQRIWDELERMNLIERGDPELARIGLSSGRSRRPLPRRLPVVWNLLMGRSKMLQLEAERPEIGSESAADSTIEAAELPGAFPQVAEGDNLSRSVTSQNSGVAFPQVAEGDNLSRSVTRQNAHGGDRSAAAGTTFRTGHQGRSEQDIRAVQNGTQDVPHNNHSKTSEQPTPAMGRRQAPARHASTSGPSGPVVVVDPVRRETGRTGGELARAVSQALPLPLRRSVSTQALRTACERLVGSVSVDKLAAAVRDHSWDGARAGAVIAWLRHDVGNLDVDDTPPVQARPTWCGQCDDERTRLVDAGEGKVRKCPTCHPSLVQPFGGLSPV